MLIKPDVLANSLDKNLSSREKIIYLSPKGKLFNQEMAKKISNAKAFLDEVQAEDRVVVEGKNVRQIIESLDQKYPGFKNRLVEDGRVKPNISVAIDGEITPLGMIEKVSEESEVHFLPAISGG